MVNLARCTWRGEPMHRSVRSPNGNANMNTRLFSIQYYGKINDKQLYIYRLSRSIKYYIVELNGI